MPSFVTVTSGTTAQAQDVNQLILAMNGTAGSGIPISLTAVNDSVNFALAVKNADPTNSRSLQVLRANNNVLLQADANGVIVSPDGGASTGKVATQTLAETWTNKTFTSPHMTGPIVDSGGLTVTAGGITVTAGGLVVVGGTAQVQTNAIAGSSLVNFLRWRQLNLANGGALQLLDGIGGIERLVTIIGDDGNGAILMCRGANTAVVFFGGAPAGYNGTQGNAATTNIYWNAGNNRYEIQNNTGATRNYSILMNADN